MTVERKNSSEVVVYLCKKISAINSGELKEQLLSLFAEGYRKITLDFSFSSLIDASGLGKICLLQKKLKEHQGELRIINVKSSYIQKIFNLVQLHKIITIEY